MMTKLLKLQRMNCQELIDQYCIDFINELDRLEKKHNFKLKNTHNHPYTCSYNKDLLNASKFEAKVINDRVYIYQYYNIGQEEHFSLHTFDILLLRTFEDDKLEEYLISKHKSLFRIEQEKACQEMLNQINYIRQVFFGDGKKEFFKNLDKLEGYINNTFGRKIR